VDPTPLFAFGHGLSYTSFAYSDLVIDQPEIGTDGTAVISCTVRNTGARAGTEVVQLYLSDPVAQVVRPARWLAGFARVPLEPGQARRVTFRLHADRTAFTGRDLQPEPAWWNRARSASRSAGPRTSCRCGARSRSAGPSARPAPAGCSTPQPRSRPYSGPHSSRAQ
jgi:hypothetical protein